MNVEAYHHLPPSPVRAVLTWLDFVCILRRSEAFLIVLLFHMLAPQLKGLTHFGLSEHFFTGNEKVTPFQTGTG